MSKIGQIAKPADPNGLMGSLAPLVYDEVLGDWFEADCQYQACGQPAVVHRPTKLLVRHVCVNHATPEELAARAARLDLPVRSRPGAPSFSLPTERS